MKRLTKVSRIQKGRNPNPTYALIDSKSVPTANKAEEKGIDGGKKKSKAESVILSLIFKVIYCTLRYIKPTSMTQNPVVAL